MSISIQGLATPGGDESRALATVKVTHNGQDYEWQIFVPVDADLGAFIAGSESKIKAEIDAKEDEWAALNPKTKQIPVGPEETITVPIEKSEIVRPEIPDYYAKRRAEYPSIGDQLDAMWKGGQIAADMLAEIQAVKDKYPKPE